VLNPLLSTSIVVAFLRLYVAVTHFESGSNGAGIFCISYQVPTYFKIKIKIYKRSLIKN